MIDDFSGSCYPRQFSDAICDVLEFGSASCQARLEAGAPLRELVGACCELRRYVFDLRGFACSLSELSVEFPKIQEEVGGEFYALGRVQVCRPCPSVAWFGVIPAFAAFLQYSSAESGPTQSITSQIPAIVPDRLGINPIVPRITVLDPRISQVFRPARIISIHGCRMRRPRVNRRCHAGIILALWPLIRLYPQLSVFISSANTGIVFNDTTSKPACSLLVGWAILPVKFPAAAASQTRSASASPSSTPTPAPSPDRHAAPTAPRPSAACRRSPLSVAHR